ncbi:MAG: flagellin [Betaproteobacteria bacterium]|nr:flagellin [Betaproteobacteria bacterium]
MDSINTNMASLYAQNNLSKSQSSVATSIQRLSSGLRINSAADDAAGYAISQNMTTQISGDNQASLNASNGVSLAQTAQGDMSTILTNLQTMYGLAVEAANATNTSADRVALNDQMQQLLQQNNLTAQSSNFNGVSLLNGAFNGETFQVGANNSASNQISISGISSMLNSALGTSSNQAAITGTATTAALAAGDLTLNGFQVGASTAGTSAGQTADSAYSIANAINAISAQSGVVATANATTANGVAATAFTGVAAGSFSINGVIIGAVAAGGTVTGEGANTAAAINLLSSQTGVTATANATTGAVTLTASDGRDINVTENGTYTTLTADTGLTAANTTGTISLASAGSASINISGAHPGSAGFTAGTTAATITEQTLSTTNLLTQTSAQNAMTAIQGAIDTVTANAAQMGALQNRFAAVVTGIQTDSQNLSTSLSAIQDTNYAAETANLSKEQVLAQAGTAMLAQANQLPNQVLTLLR